MNQTQFQKLYEEYKDKITDKELKSNFDDLNSFSENNDVLLVTVVGNLKAGKSTFFNCIINDEKDISETNFSECTIHPNFVYSSKQFSFKTYERNIDGQDDLIDINKVLNYFLYNDNTIENKLFIAEKNDKQKIQEYVRECQKMRKYLFTSFALEKPKSIFLKKLEKKRIVFVDMPGDDGEEAEEYNDKFYDTILKRTDLVLLVCSSTNDLGNSLRKYLKFIQENNKHVPFILVVNKHADKLIPEPEDTDDKQLAGLIQKLKDFNIDLELTETLNAHYIHIGLFEEERNKLTTQQDKEKVEAEIEKFNKFMDKVFDKFFSTDSIIKKTIEYNMVTRFHSQLEEFKKQLLEKISKMQSEKDKHNSKLSEIKCTLSEEQKKILNNEINNDIIAVSKSQKLSNEEWFRTKNFIKELEDYKSEYDKQIIKVVSKQVSDFKKEFEDICVDSSDIDYKYEPEIWNDDKFMSCFERKRLQSYTVDDLTNAMKILRVKLFPTEYQFQQIFEDIKMKYEKKAQEQAASLNNLEKLNQEIFQ